MKTLIDNPGPQEAKSQHRKAIIATQNIVLVDLLSLASLLPDSQMNHCTGTEYLQYIDDIIVLGNIAEEVFETEKIIQNLLKADFAIKRSKQTWIENPNCPEILEIITNWLEGTNQKWKVDIWIPMQRVAEAIKGHCESSQVAKLKALQLALDIAEQEKWPTLYLYTELWIVVLWGWLNQWRKANWQTRGNPN
ncbi:hypothetical protein BTVI_105274 [Pitangus sulphuratus]|nr:hypothetical protein BTVI_105274 [Pitangus sulphuratus]